MKYVFSIVLALIVTSCSVNQPAIIPTASATLVPPTATATPIPKPHEWIKESSGGEISQEEMDFMKSPTYMADLDVLNTQVDEVVKRTGMFSLNSLETYDLQYTHIVGIDGESGVPAIQVMMPDVNDPTKRVLTIFTVNYGNYDSLDSSGGLLPVSGGDYFLRWDPVNRQIVRVDQFNDVNQRVDKQTGFWTNEYPINLEKLNQLPSSLADLKENPEKYVRAPDPITQPEEWKDFWTRYKVHIGDLTPIVGVGPESNIVMTGFISDNYFNMIGAPGGVG